MKLFVFFIIGFVNTVAIAFFINFPFGPKFNIKDKEITKKINYGSLTPGQKNIINNINGFYGLIGPDINMDSVTNIFDLFTADGLIQGVFFDDGEITFTKHFIRTDKLNYEEQNGRIPNNRFLKLIF